MIPASQIVREQRGITADTALRLARYFDNSPEFWTNLQIAFVCLFEYQSYKGWVSLLRRFT
jgi:antitoxin HigA-1